MRVCWRAILLTLFLPAVAVAADSSSLTGIHWWGYYDYNVIDSAPAAMLDSAVVEGGKPVGAWDLEIVNTHGPAWQNAGFFQPLYNDLYANKKISLITRVEYQYGMTVPSPSTINTSTWASNVQGLVNTLKDGGHYWQLGNEPNINGEGNGWTNNQITPSGYADVYKQVRNSVQSAQVGSPGAHKLLVAPVSPGGVIANVRWISGDDWLGQTLDALKATNTPVDGVAIHAYGGTVQEFRADIARQLSIIDSKGFTDVPVFLTEWNRFADPNAGNAAAQEASAANFARDALKAINEWNLTLGNHNIMGTNWFVYDSGDRNNSINSAWAGYSIKYWNTAGNPHGNSGDLQTAFEQAADARYKAGIAGTKFIPANITTIDNFESDSGHFDKSLTFASSGSRYGFDTTNSSVTRDAGASYSKAWGEKIQVLWNGDSRGWQIRHVSGDSTPATNTQVPIPLSGTQASIGFFLRTAASGITTQLIVDGNGQNGGANSDAGRLMSIIGDDQWHFYEWNLLSASDWTNFALASGSDGIIPARGGYVTIDSIMFYGPTANATLWFDFVGVNSTGSLLTMTGVPEPISLAPLIICLAAGLARRSREARK